MFQMNNMILNRQLLLSREDALKEVFRFSTHTMFYRQNLEMHKFCCKAVGKKFLNEVQKEGLFLDIKLEDLLNYLEVHDDIEIITGDLGSHLKASMSDYEKTFWKRMEYSSIIPLNMRYGDQVDFDYIQNLIMSLEKDCTVSQLGSYIDKLVGFGLETIHEILANNQSLIKDGVDRRYIGILTELPTKLPYMADFFEKNKNGTNFTTSTVLTEVSSDLSRIILNHPFSEHTIKTISNPVGIRPYDYCVKALLDEDEEKTIQILTQRRESEPLCNLKIPSSYF